MVVAFDVCNKQKEEEFGHASRASTARHLPSCDDAFVFAFKPAHLPTSALPTPPHTDRPRHQHILAPVVAAAFLASLVQWSSFHHAPTS